MKKVFKIFAGIIALGLLVIGILWFMNNESEPVGTPGQKADEVAQKMMDAVNKQAWDTTNYIQWTFKGMHSFVWDKERHLCQVKWDKNKVLLNINSISGKAFTEGKELEGEAAKEMITKAWEFFCNDSFWLNAVVKAFDGGTKRSLVKLDDGTEGLKVEYTSGGATPGDSYVWILDENYRPTSYKMWVSIIPIGGMEFTWEKWQELSTGALISTYHKSDVLELDISGLKAGSSYADLGFSGDPFAGI